MPLALPVARRIPLGHEPAANLHAALPARSQRGARGAGKLLRAATTDKGGLATQQENGSSSSNGSTRDDPVVYVDTLPAFEELMQQQPSEQLTVVEVVSPIICEMGMEEEAELHWELDRKAQLAKCIDLVSQFEHIASDCPDIKFVSVTVEGKDDPLCAELGVEVIPCLQFYRGDRRVWEHRGLLQLQQELAEGVLYYGDTAANNEKASSSVVELVSREDLDRFVRSTPQNVLAVVNVSVEVCEPCMHVFPAVLALAKAFKGYAAFGRLMGEEDGTFEKLLADLRVEEVPTFLFYRNGKEVGRFVGSQRGDLIGQILRIQDKAGVAPPPPPPRPRRPPQPKVKKPKAKRW